MNIICQYKCCECNREFTISRSEPVVHCVNSNCNSQYFTWLNIEALLPVFRQADQAYYQSIGKGHLDLQPFR